MRGGLPPLPPAAAAALALVLGCGRGRDQLLELLQLRVAQAGVVPVGDVDEDVVLGWMRRQLLMLWMWLWLVALCSWVDETSSLRWLLWLGSLCSWVDETNDGSAAVLFKRNIKKRSEPAVHDACAW